MDNLKPHKSVEQIAKKHRLDVSFIRNQLEMGIPIEHEHTANKVLATDIALQHLDEIPDYYTRLKKMEASAKKEHKKFKDMKEDAVTDLQRGIVELPNASYESIDNLMRRIMKKRKVSAKKLHDDFVDKHHQTPDTWAKKNMKEDLRDWFGKGGEGGIGGGGWDRYNSKGERIGKCAKEDPNEPKPKCLSKEKASQLRSQGGANAIANAVKNKRTNDPISDRSGKGGKPIMVSNQIKEENIQEKNVPTNPSLWSKMKAKARSKFDVYPSAYANGWAAKEYKKSGGGWKTVSEGNLAQQAAIAINMKKKGIKPKSEMKEDCWDGYEQKGMKKKGKKMVPNCVSVKEASEMQRYCPKCDKNETRKECKYGEKYWDMFSRPITLGKDYTPNTPHPGNFPESFKIDPEKHRKQAKTNSSAAKKLRDMSTSQQAQLPKEMVKKVIGVDLPRFKESLTIEDSDGNHYAEFIDIIKPEPLKASRGIGSKLLGEGLSFEIGNKKTTGLGGMTPQDVERLKQGNPGAAEKIDQKYQQIRRGISLPLAKKETKKEVQVAHYNMKTFGRFMSEANEVRGNLHEFLPVIAAVGEIGAGMVGRAVAGEVAGAIGGAASSGIRAMAADIIGKKVGDMAATKVKKTVNKLTQQNSNDNENVDTNKEEFSNWRFDFGLSEASAAWQRKEGKNPEGGLNKKGIASYRREHPGSHLSLAVTTKPSKLKPGSKSANRRKSFCSRSAGQMKMWPKAAKDPNSRLRLARKKWNC